MKSAIFFIVGGDRLLRRMLGIREFTSDPACVLRLTIARATDMVCLADGTTVVPGDRAIQLHMWNENMAQVENASSLFAWAVTLRRHVLYSLRLLAEVIAHDEELRSCAGVYVHLPRTLVRHNRIFQFHGWIKIHVERTFLQKVHDFFESFLIYALMWAFHPRGPQRDKIRLERMELWISTESFLRIFGDQDYLGSLEPGRHSSVSG